MAKKAFLVVTTFMSRVVVDEDLENEDNYSELVKQTEERILEKIRNGETSENIEDVFLDEDVPYGTLEGED